MLISNVRHFAKQARKSSINFHDFAMNESGLIFGKRRPDPSRKQTLRQYVGSGYGHTQAKTTRLIFNDVLAVIHRDGIHFISNFRH
jgi:hypothetical protein